MSALRNIIEQCVEFQQQPPLILMISRGPSIAATMIVFDRSCACMVSLPSSSVSSRTCTFDQAVVLGLKMNTPVALRSPPASGLHPVTSTATDCPHLHYAASWHPHRSWHPLVQPRPTQHPLFHRRNPPTPLQQGTTNLEGEPCKIGLRIRPKS